MAIDFLLFLTAGELHLGGVDNHNMVTSIDKRRVAGLVLTHQHKSSLASQLTEDLTFRVDNMPCAGNTIL